MRDRSNHLEKQVAVAAEKVLGSKFCFSCQRQKPLANGKMVKRGKSTIWRCLECLNKKYPVGFR